MKQLFATTAIALLTAGPVLAESHVMSTGGFVDSTNMETGAQADLRVSNLIGKRVYTVEGGTDMAVADEAETDWDDIGEINDVILSRDGSMEAILVDVGGFLGLGEKTVAVDMRELTMVADGDDEDDYFVVFNAGRAALENAPAFDVSSIGTWWDNATMNNDGTKKTDAAMTTEETAAMGDSANSEMPAATGPMIERDGYMAAEATDLTAEKLTGAPVYGIEDDRIGEISDLVVDGDTITGVIIDVGGFLGIGEKPVMVKMDAVTVLRSDNGDDVRIYMDTTEDALEEMPAYEG